MKTERTDDPLRTMTVERLEREDGRYLIYFAWPSPDEAPSEDPTGEPEDV